MGSSKQYVLAKLQIQWPAKQTKYFGAGPTRKDGHHEVIVNVKRRDFDAQDLVGHYDCRSRNGKIGKRSRHSQSHRSNEKRLLAAGNVTTCPLGQRQNPVVVRKTKHGTAEEAQHALIPTNAAQSTLNARPVDMPRVPPEEAGAGIGNGQLRDAQACGRFGEQVCRHGNAEEVVEASSELSLHLVLAQIIAEDKVKGIVHPTKALAIAHQLHEKSGRGQDGHAGDETVAGNDVV